MKEIEAIKQLERISKLLGSIGEKVDYTDILIEALEKQIPKKALVCDFKNGTVNYGCPICRRKIVSKINGDLCGGFQQVYCDICGQKLDWSVEE